MLHTLLWVMATLSEKVSACVHQRVIATTTNDGFISTASTISELKRKLGRFYTYIVLKLITLDFPLIIS